MDRFIVALFVLYLTFLAPLTPFKKDADKLPDISGQTNWGYLDQTGRNFSITGHDKWQAIGSIRKDGKVQLIWTQLSNKEPCPGVYSIREKDNALVGVWGYSNRVNVEPDGSLSGEVQSDITFHVKE